MRFSSRDIVFIIAAAILGLLIALATRAGHLKDDGATPPLLLIFLGMAALELAGGAIARAPLGQFIAMPARFVALVAAFGVFLLTRNL